MDIVMACHMCRPFTCACPNTADLAVRVVDHGHPETNSQLLGAGQDPSLDEWPIVLSSLQQVLQDYGEILEIE